MGTQHAVATSCRVSLLFFIRARPVLLRIPNSRESVPRQASTARGDTRAVWNSLQEGDILQRPPQKSPWTRSVPPELSYTLPFNAAWFELVFPSLSPLGISVWINQPIVQRRKRHNRILRLFRPPAPFGPQPGGGSAQSAPCVLLVRCASAAARDRAPRQPPSLGARGSPGTSLQARPLSAEGAAGVSSASQHPPDALEAVVACGGGTGQPGALCSLSRKPSPLLRAGCQARLQHTAHPPSPALLAVPPHCSSSPSSQQSSVYHITPTDTSHLKAQQGAPSSQATSTRVKGS